MVICFDLNIHSLSGHPQAIGHAIEWWPAVKTIEQLRSAKAKTHQGPPAMLFRLYRLVFRAASTEHPGFELRTPNAAPVMLVLCTLISFMLFESHKSVACWWVQMPSIRWYSMPSCCQLAMVSATGGPDAGSLLTGVAWCMGGENVVPSACSKQRGHVCHFSWLKSCQLELACFILGVSPGWYYCSKRQEIDIDS